MDFKGEFRTADGSRVRALTVRDQASRHLLAVRHLVRSDERTVRAYLQRLFRQHGLPRAIHVDNGPPFGSSGPLGLSPLSAWWVHLGIRLHFSRPGCPQDNGAHEQTHRVLKRQTTRPTAPNLASQQRRFDRWRHRYNHHRPHQSLGQTPPATRYRLSPRALPASLPPFSYPALWTLAVLDPRGRYSWQGRPRHIGRAFAGQTLGLKLRSLDRTEVYFGPLLLGTLHRHDLAGLRPVQRLPPK
jgi:hypothetical protein